MRTLDPQTFVCLIQKHVGTPWESKNGQLQDDLSQNPSSVSDNQKALQHRVLETLLSWVFARKAASAAGIRRSSEDSELVNSVVSFRSVDDLHVEGLKDEGLCLLEWSHQA